MQSFCVRCVFSNEIWPSWCDLSRRSDAAALWDAAVPATKAVSPQHPNKPPAPLQKDDQKSTERDSQLCYRQDDGCFLADCGWCASCCFPHAFVEFENEGYSFIKTKPQDSCDCHSHNLAMYFGVVLSSVHFLVTSPRTRTFATIQCLWASS